MTLKEKLSAIQVEMKAPKNLYNSFGKYKYRNAEGILEAFKPFEEKYRVVLTLSDSIESALDRVYIKATAQISDLDSNDFIIASAMAREAFDKKGMDESQITGTASSYARKYCLNGLLLLDDTKDADSDEAHIESEARAAKEKKISALKAKALEGLLKEKNVDIGELCRRFGVPDLQELTEEQHNKIVRMASK